MARVKGHGYQPGAKATGGQPATGGCKCGWAATATTASAVYAGYQVHLAEVRQQKLITSKFPFKPVWEGEEIVGWRAPKEGESGWETYMSA